MFNPHSSLLRGFTTVTVKGFAFVNFTLLSLATAALCQGNNSPLGLNLSGFEYWTTQVPFKNVYGQQPHNWILGGWPAPPAGTTITQYTEDGTPLVWDTAYAPFKYVFIHGPAAYPAGPWALLYDGQGEFGFDWDAKDAVKTAEGRYTFTTVPKDGFIIRLLRTNRQDPVHNIRIVEQKYEGNYSTEPWYPPLIDLCKEFSTLRFMDWMGASSDTAVTGSYTDWGAAYKGVVRVTTTTVTLDTNASTVSGAYNGMIISSSSGNRLIISYDGSSRTATVAPGFGTPPAAGSGYSVMDFPNHEWKDRCKPADLAQNSMRGMAVEWLVDLCNRTNCAPWFSLPSAASDDYIRQFATYVRDHLNSNLRVYIEWSNEAWNYSYPGWTWSDAMGQRVGIGGFSGYPAYRMVQMFRIWDDVFGEPHLRSQRSTSRLQRVLAVQGGYVGRAQELLDFDGSKISTGYANPIDPGKKACDYADVVAVTNYIGEGVDNVKKFATTLSVDQMVDSLKREIDLRCAPTGTDGSNYWYLDVAMARQRGLNCVTYESGVSLYNTPFDSAAGVKLDEMEKSPRMKELYRYCLDKWKAIGVDAAGKGAALWNQFGDTQWSMGNGGQWGHWGIRQSYWQPIDSCPKWQALREFAQQSPRWWTDAPMTAVRPDVAGRHNVPLKLSLTMRNEGAVVRYKLGSDCADARLLIQSLDGRVVKTLVRGRTSSGEHRVVWDGRSDAGKKVSKGVYLCRLSAGRLEESSKMTLLR